jgi:hypothetical protein
LVLNLVLAGGVVYGCVQLRREWLAARMREQAMLSRRVPPLPMPQFTPAPMEPPLTAAGYAAIANQMLFDKSRNPVVVEVVAPPPPPPPMPPLPVYHGMMNVGDGGPTLFFRLAGKEEQAVHVGDRIGEFKLIGVNREGITFEWNGQRIHKNMEELSESSRGEEAGAATGRTAPPEAASAPPPAPPASRGPGEDTGRGYRMCTMNDGVAEGAVVDGYRKVTYVTPFGTACRYEPAN